MRSYEIESFGQLLDLVDASESFSHDSGSKVVEATIWDGRVVSASYYKDDPKLANSDAKKDGGVLWDFASLVPMIRRLLENGQSFVTCTGDDKMFCVLEWSIRQ